MPHCLGILKSSQLLTEEVIKAVVTKEENRGKNDAMALVTAGHMITSHVDAVVKALYPPLDLGLLEARWVWKGNIQREFEFNFEVWH